MTFGSSAEKSPCRCAALGVVMETPLGAERCAWSCAEPKKNMRFLRIGPPMVPPY